MLDGSDQILRGSQLGEGALDKGLWRRRNATECSPPFLPSRRLRTNQAIILDLIEALPSEPPT